MRLLPPKRQPGCLISGIRGEERGNWVRLQVGEINYKGLIKLKELTKPYQQRYGYFFVKQSNHTFGKIRIHKRGKAYKQGM